MPQSRHENPKFLALLVTGGKQLAETECAMCEGFAPLNRRADGWVEVRCGCGYTEAATELEPLQGLMKIIVENEKTIYPRTTKAAVMEALGMDGVEPAPIEGEAPAQSIPTAPESVAVGIDCAAQDEETAPATDLEPEPVALDPEHDVQGELETFEEDGDHAALYGA